MARNDIFEIEVLSWEEHQTKLKKNHSHFMVSKRIFDNHKVATLTSLERLLYLIMLARCADENAATIRPTRQQLLTNLGQTRHDVVRSVVSLERNQLVRVAKWPLNTIQDKTKEDNTKQKKANSVRERKPKIAALADSASPVPTVQDLIAHYCSEYKNRYGANPVVRGQDAGLLKTVGKSLGSEKTKRLLTAYLSMSTQWFLTRSHDVVTFNNNLNPIQVFAETGRVVTMSDAKNAESSDALKNQIARLTGDAS